MVSKFDETMQQQMQKLSNALEASQERWAADLTNRIEHVEERLRKSVDAERRDREENFKDVQSNLSNSRSSSRDERQVEATEAQTALAEFTASAINDLHTKIESVRAHSDAAIASIAAQKQECASGAAQNPALQSIETKFQDIMEQQIQKLAVSLSAAVERRFADVSTRIQQAEERWASNADGERQEVHGILTSLQQEVQQQRSTLANMELQASQLLNAGSAQASISDNATDLDLKFEALQKKTDVALRSICDHKEELTTMIRNATAELCGSMAQQQQQQQEFRRLRQQLQDDQKELREQLQQGPAPNDTSSKVKLQPVGPYMDLSARQVDLSAKQTDLSTRQEEQHSLIKGLQQQLDEWRHLVDQSLASQQSPQQPELTPSPQTSALEAIGALRAELGAQQEAVRDLKQGVMKMRQVSDPDDSLPAAHKKFLVNLKEELTFQQRALGDEVTGRVLDLTKQWSETLSEVTTLRQAMNNDFASLRTEVDSFASELDTVQTSVVMRVGEVCSQTLQDWKDNRAEGLTRLEGRVTALQETTSNLTTELHRRVAQLLGELKLEREDRCKSVADLHVQYVQLNVAAQEATQNLKSQHGQFGALARAVECLQLQCKALPINFAMLAPEVMSPIESPSLRR